MSTLPPVNRAEDIAELLVARLATLTKAQGAETDIGRSVLRGRKRIDDTQIPCTVVIEGEDALTRSPRGVTLYKIAQEYEIHGYVPCLQDHPNTAAHAVLRDIKRAVFGDGATLGGRVREVRYLGRDIGPRADGSSFVLAVVSLEIEYVEDVASP